MVATGRQRLGSITDAEQRAYLRLMGLLEQGAAVDVRLVVAGGEAIVLPPRFATILRTLVRQLAQGNDVVVSPIPAELTTQKAAALLNVSRPYLIKLLEQGEIPFRVLRSHRRLRLDDVLRYKARRDRERRQVLAEVAAGGQELEAAFE